MSITPVVLDLDACPILPTGAAATESTFPPAAQAAFDWLTDMPGKLDVFVNSTNAAATDMQTLANGIDAKVANLDIAVATATTQASSAATSASDAATAQAAAESASDAAVTAKNAAQSASTAAAQSATDAATAKTAAESARDQAQAIATDALAGLLGQPGGIATLDAAGLVPLTQLPVTESPAIRTPTILSPADGTMLTSSTPTIQSSTYRSLYGVAQASMTIEIATDAAFANVIYAHAVTGAVVTHTMPTGYIEASGEYWIGITYTDEDGASSARAVAHVTTAASLEHVVTPTLTAPAAGATVYEQPTLTASAFAVSSGSDTHVASQWRIKTTAGTWDTPLWDSGETTTALLSITVPAGYITAGGGGYDIEMRQKGSAYGWSDWSMAVSVVSATQFANIIGVACVATGGGGGTWAWIDSAGNAFTPAVGYFNSHPVFGGMSDVTIDSQAMVKIPKFYVKRATLTSGPYSGKEAWWVSDQAATGFHLHPAFYNAGAAVDQVYVGKYQASSDGTKLKSVAGVLPAVSTTLTAFQGLAAARNVSGVTGFMLWSVYHWSAIQWLYLLENATMDSQTKTGQGRVNQSSAANVDASDVAQATYLGLVGLWGNVFQWLDGLKTDGTQICLWDNSGNKTWVTTGRKRTAATKIIYPLTFMAQSGVGYNFSDVFIGDDGPTSNSGATSPDYQYFNESYTYVPLVGWGWDGGTDAGLWCVDCGHPASFSYTIVGARLAKV